MEATAWVLITLKLCNEDPNSECISKGTDFLLKVAHKTEEYCCWGAFKEAEPRIYPTLLAAWALSDIRNDFSVKGAEWLKNAVNSDGGWGFHPNDGASNTAMTAMTLYVLLTTKCLFGGEMLKAGVKWIKSHWKNDGTWGNNIEDWISYIDPETNDSIPTQTKHFSTAWAIILLIKADALTSDPQLVEDSLSVPASSQEQDGSWIFSQDDPKKHTWCIANAVLALEDARTAFYSPSGFVHYIEQSTIRKFKDLRWFVYISIINFSIIILAIIGVIFYLTGSVENLQEIVISIKEYFQRNTGAILASIIATVIFSIAVIIYRVIRKGRTYFRKRNHT